MAGVVIYTSSIYLVKISTRRTFDRNMGYNIGNLPFKVYSMRFIPIYTFIKSHPRTAKDIQRAPNSQIDLPLTTCMNLFKVFKAARSTSISNWY